MAKLFLTVLSLSATASVVILLVLLVRLALRKAPKVFSYALWAAVLLRLLCPFSIPNPWSRTPTVRVSPSGRLPSGTAFGVLPVWSGSPEPPS